MQTLIEQHVDDVNADFAIAAPGPRLKDFVGTYFTGSVAAGIAYLVMIDDGYLWADHFENFAVGTAQNKQPDFVFEKQSQVALVESKGSRAGTVGGFNRTVQDGYNLQVEPHLGQVVGGRTASFGVCIGTFMKSPVKAEVLLHQTGLPVSGGSAGGSGSASDDTSNPAGDDGAPLSPIQRGNYATVFALCHSADLGFRFREGVLPDEVEFDRFFWQGRSWLTAPLSAAPDNGSLDQPLLPASDLSTFAIAEEIAYRVLAAVSAGRYGALPIFLGKTDLVLTPKEVILKGDEGAIFPDGMAVVSAETSSKSRQRLRVRLSPEMAGDVIKPGITSFSHDQNDLSDQQTYISQSLD